MSRCALQLANLNPPAHSHRQATAGPAGIPPELEEELFSRNRFFFEGGFDAIRDSLVIVVGLGGVGSHAAHMLVSMNMYFVFMCMVLSGGSKYICVRVYVCVCVGAFHSRVRRVSIGLNPWCVMGLPHAAAQRCWFVHTTHTRMYTHKHTRRERERGLTVHSTV